MNILKRKYPFLSIFIFFIFFLFLIFNFSKSEENKNDFENYLEISIDNPVSKKEIETEKIFLNIDPLFIKVISLNDYPKASFIIENSSKKTLPLFEKNIKKGENVYSLDFALEPDIYTLKLEINGNIYSKKFIIKNSFLKYQILYPFVLKFYYPNWQILDHEIVEKIYTNFLKNSVNEKVNGFKVMLVVKNQNGAQFAVFSREIKEKKENSFNFIDYINDLEKKEKEILFNVDFVQDYKIFKKEIKNNEANYQTETLSNGINYSIVSKSFLIENFLKQKYLITFNFTFPKKDFAYYQNFINFIFENLNY